MFAHLLLTVAVVGVAEAQVGAIGLSSLRSVQLENPNLLFFDPQVGDLFSFSLTVGDFNGDGADDLATGIPYDDGVTGLEVIDAGAVTVRYGVPGVGLGGAIDFLSQFSAGSPDPDEAGDRFGQALAAGDFNGDGKDDLAIGVPGNDGGGDPPVRGGVAIHYGLTGGIEPDAEHFLERGSSGLPLNYSMYEFGRALAAGDFDGDGKDDLAVGTPTDTIFLASPNTATEGGRVTVLHGGAGGLLPYSGYEIDQSNSEIADSAEDFDHFGWAIATGDFNGDGFDDLAIGVPREDGTGAVQIVFGSSFGLLFANNVIYRQGEAGGGGLAETGDEFGSTLAAGDFDGDGFDDLAVGAPLEDEGSFPLGSADTGAISVLYGSAGGFNIPRTDYFQQSTIYGIASADQAGDNFGQALAAGDFDGDGFDDLAIGHPGENGDGADRGATTVLMGAPGGFLSRYRSLRAGVAGTAGSTQDSQDFGRSLAAGDFDGNGFADLAIGVPYFDVAGIGANVGAEVVLYGAMFADGFEGENSSIWSSVAP